MNGDSSKTTHNEIPPNLIEMIRQARLATRGIVAAWAQVHRAIESADWHVVRPLASDELFAEIDEYVGQITKLEDTIEDVNRELLARRLFRAAPITSVSVEEKFE